MSSDLRNGASTTHQFVSIHHVHGYPLLRYMAQQSDPDLYKFVVWWSSLYRHFDDEKLEGMLRGLM